MKQFYISGRDWLSVNTEALCVERGITLSNIHLISRAYHDGVHSGNHPDRISGDGKVGITSSRNRGLSILLLPKAACVPQRLSVWTPGH